MSKPSVHRFLALIRQRVRQQGADASDGNLLRHFADTHDEAAFAQLMDRHSGLVWNVCRRVLGHGAAAEDAFQATFLVLVRQATTITKKDSLSSWLHSVAYRTAHKLRRADLARKRREEQVPLRAAADGAEELNWKEIRQVLDEELQRLPEKYQLPLLLCYLEGKTQDEATQTLGWTLGVFRGRLDRGRERLRKRLLQRGIGLPGALAAILAADCMGQAAVPAPLMALTVQYAAGKAVLPTSVKNLVEGVIRAMLWTKLTWTAVLILSFGVLAAGAGLMAQPAAPGAGADAPEVADNPAPGFPQAKEQPPKVPLDVYGDPLPPGAVTRLGTVRGGHRAPVERVAFSPDNQMVFSFDNQGTIRSWDVATGKEIRRSHQPMLFAPTAAFAANGKIAAFLNHHKVCLWDLVAGKEIHRLSLATLGYQMALTPDGKTFAVGDDTGVLHLWDTAAGKEIRQLRGHKQFVDTLTFAPDGKMLASGSRDGTVRLWDWAAGKEVQRLDKHEGAVTAVAFAPDGQTLASADAKCVRQWQVAGGNEIQRVEKEHTSFLAFAAAGKALALGDAKAVCLNDTATGKEIRRFEVPENEGLRSMAVSSDGKTLALGWGIGHLELYQLATGKRSQRLDGWRLDQIEALAFAPDGKTVASGEQDHTIRCWDRTTGKEVGRLRGHKGPIDSLVFLPDGKTLASASADMTVRLWDLSTGKETRQFPWRINRCLAKPGFTPDGKTMISGSGDGVLRIWDVATGKEVRQLEIERGISAGPLSPDGQILVQMDFVMIRLVDFATGKEIRQLPVHEGDAVHSVTFSPDGRTIAVACGSEDQEHGAIQLLEMATGQEIRRLSEPRGAIYHVAFSPDGRTIASAGFGEIIRLWESATGKEIQRWEGHEGRIMSLAFAPDETSLASVSEDATILLWDVRRLGRPQHTRDLADKDLREFWTALAGSDAAKAYGAIAELADAPKQAVPFLQHHMQPLKAIPAPQLDQLLSDLDGQNFTTRQKAADELEKLGPTAEAGLRKALAAKPSLEVQKRLEQLLAKAITLTPDRLRELRAIGALERMATSEAKQLLQTLAKEPGYPQATRDEAQAALARVARGD